MCELFGLSASRPMPGRALPLAEFGARGGALADNPDGWGVAWREAGAFRLDKEPLPACGSARFLGLIETLRTDLAIAHVRKARLPPVNTPFNTHPFLRACCERQWIFAHNGLVPEIVALEAANDGRVCRPEGETDSESAFCHLLSHVSRHGHAGAGDSGWLAVLAEVSERIARHGKFNFLLSDGEHLIAYGHDRLHYRETADAAQAVTLIAIVPLGDASGWRAFAPGELRIYRAGARVARFATHPPVPTIDPPPSIDPAPRVDPAASIDTEPA